MTAAWWGVDPGTANMGAVLVDDRGPLLILDITTKPATKGGKRTEPKPKRLVLHAWQRSEEGIIPLAGTHGLEFVADQHDAVDVLVAHGLLGLGDQAAVEDVVGNVSPHLSAAAGIAAGVLWSRTGGKRPARPTAGRWRKRMLDLPGTCPAVEAERVAVARVREEVPGWPVEASGHAAEAYWIARWGAECAG